MTPTVAEVEALALANEFMDCSVNNMPPTAGMMERAAELLRASVAHRAEVPREPTAEMQGAGHTVVGKNRGYTVGILPAVWRAMWDAAPRSTPTTQMEGDCKACKGSGEGIFHDQEGYEHIGNCSRCGGSGNEPSGPSGAGGPLAPICPHCGRHYEAMFEMW